MSAELSQQQETAQQFRQRLRQEAKALCQAVHLEQRMGRTDFDFLLKDSGLKKALPDERSWFKVVEAMYRDHGKVIKRTVRRNNELTKARFYRWCRDNGIDAFTGIPPGTRPGKERTAQ